MELDVLKTDDIPVTSTNDSVATVASNGDVVVEATSLLHSASNGSNGEAVSENHRGGRERSIGSTCASLKDTRIYHELNREVFKKVRVWMLLALVLCLIPVIVVISLAICAAIHVDEDDIYDSSSFTVPQSFNGSFQIPSNSSTEGATLEQLQRQLVDLYKSSPALGRYFSEATVNAPQYASDVVEYRLTFVLPQERLGELRNFTLSREMVQNVFRQFLYDQDQPRIDPVSLKMSSGH